MRKRKKKKRKRKKKKKKKKRKENIELLPSLCEQCPTLWERNCMMQHEVVVCLKSHLS